MPGGRPIEGRDVIALVRAFAPDCDEAALRAAIAPERVFADVGELRAALASAGTGLAPGRIAALLGPLFGEFE